VANRHGTAVSCSTPSSNLREIIERKSRLTIPNFNIHKILTKFTKYRLNSQNVGNIHKILAIFTHWQNSQNIDKINKIFAETEKVGRKIYVICEHFKENMNKFTWIGWRWEDHPHGSRSIGSRYSCSDLPTTWAKA
jgi:hypothetical protein